MSKKTSRYTEINIPYTYNEEADKDRVLKHINSSTTKLNDIFDIAYKHKYNTDALATYLLARNSRTSRRRNITEDIDELHKKVKIAGEYNVPGEVINPKIYRYFFERKDLREPESLAKLFRGKGFTPLPKLNRPKRSKSNRNNKVKYKKYGAGFEQYADLDFATRTLQKQYEKLHKKRQELSNLLE